MKRIFTVTALAICTFGLQAAQYKSNEMTGAFRNGRWWTGVPQSVEEALKLGYLSGFWDGLARGVISGGPELSLEETNSRIDVSTITELTHGETIKALDLFYSDPANANIAIPSALSYVKRKVIGWSPNQLRDYEAKLRASAVRILNE